MDLWGKEKIIDIEMKKASLFHVSRSPLQITWPDCRGGGARWTNSPVAFREVCQGDLQGAVDTGANSSVRWKGLEALCLPHEDKRLDELYAPWPQG